MTVKMALALGMMVGLAGCCSFQTNRIIDYRVEYGTQTDPVLRAQIERIDASLRAKYGMSTEQSAVGLMDLRTGQLAMTPSGSGRVRREHSKDRNSPGILRVAS